MYKKILAAYDGSEGAKVALERACDVAKEFSAVITMAWVRSPLPHYAADIGEVEDEKEAADEYFEQLRRDAMTAAASRGISIDCVCLKGNAAREIVQFADTEKYDLIVIGRWGIRILSEEFWARPRTESARLPAVTCRSCASPVDKAAGLLLLK